MHTESGNGFETSDFYLACYLRCIGYTLDDVRRQGARVPPSSVKPARQYFLRLASKGVPCYSVITKLVLEKTKNGQGIVYSKAALTAGGRLTPEQATRAKQYAAMIDPFLKAVPAVPTPHDLGEAADGEVI